MDDFALMQKYRLSTKGLQSLFKKLMQVGLVQQVDIDRRNIGFEHTVTLTEDMLSLSAALKSLGLYKPAGAASKGAHLPSVVADEKPISPQPEEPAPVVEEKVESVALPDDQPRMGPNRMQPDMRSFERGRWYDNPGIIVGLLIALFPVGL